MTSVLESTTCLNCGAALGGPFCAQCGQKAEGANPSLHDFIHHLVHEVAHLDGKLRRSSVLLLTRPGFLTREYFDGRIARYVSPIRLYLTFSVLYFAVATVAPVAVPRMTCNGCPPEVKAHVETAMHEAFTHWTPREMFLLVPVFAAFIAIAMRGRERHYPQHLYFAMHVHAAWFFAAAALGALGSLKVPWLTTIASWFATIYGVSYLAIALRRAYDASWTRSIVSAVLTVFVYWAVALAALAAILIPIVFSITSGH